MGVLACSFTRRKSNLADMMEALQDPPVVLRSSHRYCTVISATDVEVGAVLLSFSHEAACLQLFEAQEQSGRHDGGHAGAKCTGTSQVCLNHACIGQAELVPLSELLCRLGACWVDAMDLPAVTAVLMSCSLRRSHGSMEDSAPLDMMSPKRSQHLHFDIDEDSPSIRRRTGWASSSTPWQCSTDLLPAPST